MRSTTRANTIWIALVLLALIVGLWIWLSGSTGPHGIRV